MRYCGYLTRDGEFINLSDYKRDKEYNSVHTQYCNDNNLDEDSLMETRGWIKFTLVCDCYIYTKFSSISAAQYYKMVEMGIKVEPEDCPW